MIKRIDEDTSNSKCKKKVLNSTNQSFLNAILLKYNFIF